MQNLELKVRCTPELSLERIEDLACSAGANYISTLRQRDTYFPVPYGRLKLREWWRQEDELRGPNSDEEPSRPFAELGSEAGSSGATLIAYKRPDSEGSRMSDYLLSPVSESLTLRTVLAEALSTRVIIEKRRVLYQYGATRIHLDTVRGLGTFVELETVFSDLASPDDLTTEHRQLIELLHLNQLPVIAHSYSDLLERLAQ